MKASLNTYRQSPRKVRLLADLIRGKNVKDALEALLFADKRAAPVFLKVLKSAIANATNNNQEDTNSLFVKEVTVNQGVILKRMMPRARGSGARINKRTSHIDIVLGSKSVTAVSPVAKEKPIKKEPTKKTPVKKVTKAKKA